MKTGKKRGRLLIVFALIAVIVSALTVVSIGNVAFAYDTYQTFATDREMLSAANTYDCTEVTDGASGVYKTTYDMSQKNERQVMGYPQITVLTHGLGGSAANWSNYVDGDGVVFASDEQSLLKKIVPESSNIYWARIEADKKDFKLYNISNEVGTYNRIHEKKIDDISKHIVIVFEATRNGRQGTNDSVYYEFNHMLSKVVLDVAYLNGGILPKVNLIGHSRGGITNLQYALDHPDLVDSLISIGTPYFGTTSGSVFGPLVMGDSAGLNDIINPDIYYGYNTRWNNNYDALYKNINAVAIGGYQSIPFLIEAVAKDNSGFLNDGAKIGAGAALSALIPVLLASKASVIPTTGLYLLTELLDAIFPGSAAVDAAEILYKEINLDYHPPFLSWYNDALCPLESALAKDAGSFSVPGGGDYKGFQRKTRFFNVFDGTDFTKVAENMPPVPHNLETRDAKIIDWIVDSCRFGANQNSAYRTAPVSDTEVKITGYRGEIGGTFVVPETIAGKTVVEIGDYAFSDNFGGNEVNAVQIPSTVRKIGNGAFENCTKLQTVEFTGNPAVTVLGNSAFANCEKLSFPLPATLLEIGSGAFANCSAFATIGIGENVASIGEAAFLNCRNLNAFTGAEANPAFKISDGVLYDREMTKIVAYPSGQSVSTFTAPSTVKTIDDFAFYKNQNLTAIDLNQVETIGASAFYESAVLTFEGGNQITEIGSNAFDGAPWLRSAEGGNFKKLGNFLVRYNGSASALEAADLPSGIRNIYEFAFSDSQLETIAVPGDLESIGIGILSNCPNLTEVRFGASAVHYSDFLFADSENLSRVYFESTYAPSGYIFGIGDVKPTLYVPYSAQNTYRDSMYLKNAKIETVTTTISFSDSQGGNVFPDATVPYGSTIANLPQPTRSGYAFGGWYENTDFSGNIIVDGSYWDRQTNVTLFAKWNPIQNVISFSGDGVTGVEPMTVTYDEEFGNLPAPVREGYAFVAWKNTDGEVFEGNRIWNGTENITLTAEWRANVYQLTFDANGGTVSPSTKDATYGESIITLPIPLRNGYRFTEWNTSRDGSGETFSESVVYRNAADTALYAQWEIVEYTIVYDLNGGAITGNNPESYTIEDTPIGLELPTKDGYTFDGWQSGNGISKEIALGTFGDLRLAASWTANVYAVTLNSNYGKSEIYDTVPITFGESFHIDYTPVREGYEFDGWFDRNGVYYAGTDGESARSWDKSEDCALFAHWGLKRFEVRIEGDGTLVWLGAGGLKEEKELIEYGAIVNYADFRAKYGYREGKIFDYFSYKTVVVNWDTIPDLGPSGTVVSIEPIWKSEHNRIYFDTLSPNIVSEIEADFGADIVLPTIGADQGYRFDGWYDAAVGGNKINWTKMPDLTPNEEGNGSIKLFARIVPIQYTIAYRLDGGTNNAGNPQIYTIETAFTFLNPTKYGYRFEGWYRDSAYRNPIAELNSTFGNLSLYAKWSATTYLVAFDSNDGTATREVQTFTYDQSGYLAKNSFLYQGHRFEGWALDADGAVVFSDEARVININNGSAFVILYAVWSLKTFTITYDANDGSGEVFCSRVYTFGEDEQLAQNVFSKYAYNLFGWRLTPNGNLFCFYIAKVSDVSPEGDDVTLYAHWSAVSYRITYQLDGASSNPNPSYYTIESTVVLKPAEKLGYDFLGWTDASGRTVTTISGTGERTLIAKWYGYGISVTNQSRVDISAANFGGYDTAILNCSDMNNVTIRFNVKSDIKKVTFIGGGLFAKSNKSIVIENRTTPLRILLSNFRIMAPTNESCLKSESNCEITIENHGKSSLISGGSTNSSYMNAGIYCPNGTVNIVGTGELILKGGMGESSGVMGDYGSIAIITVHSVTLTIAGGNGAYGRFGGTGYNGGAGGEAQRGGDGGNGGNGLDGGSGGIALFGGITVYDGANVTLTAGRGGDGGRGGNGGNGGAGGPGRNGKFLVPSKEGGDGGNGGRGGNGGNGGAGGVPIVGQITKINGTVTIKYGNGGDGGNAGNGGDGGNGGAGAKTMYGNPVSGGSGGSSGGGGIGGEKGTAGTYGTNSTIILPPDPKDYDSSVSGNDGTSGNYGSSGSYGSNG